MAAKQDLTIHVGEDKPLNMDFTDVIQNASRSLVLSNADFSIAGNSGVTVDSYAVSGQQVQATFDATGATAGRYKVTGTAFDDQGYKHIDYGYLTVEDPAQ